MHSLEESLKNAAEKISHYMMAGSKAQAKPYTAMSSCI